MEANVYWIKVLQKPWGGSVDKEIVVMLTLVERIGILNCWICATCNTENSYMLKKCEVCGTWGNLEYIEWISNQAGIEEKKTIAMVRQCLEEQENYRRTIAKQIRIAVWCNNLLYICRIIPTVLLIILFLYIVYAGMIENKWNAVFGAMCISNTHEALKAAWDKLNCLNGTILLFEGRGTSFLRAMKNLFEIIIDKIYFLVTNFIFLMSCIFDGKKYSLIKDSTVALFMLVKKSLITLIHNVVMLGEVVKENIKKMDSLF